MLLFGKSYFTSRDKNNIKHGQDFARAEAVIKDGDGEIQKLVLKLQVSKNKVLEHNGIKIPRLTDYIGTFLNVCVSPEDIILVNGLSSDRRSFLDQCISQYNKKYTQALSSYLKTVQQRNALLKSFLKKGMYNSDLVKALNEPLIKNAPLIYEFRSEFLNEFVEYFEKAYQEIAPGLEIPNLEYISKLEHDSMEVLLEQYQEKDRITGRTNAGVHKDDIRLLLNDTEVKTFGSQGQIKSFVVALKMAQFEYLVRKTNKIPIFILDDMFDKLDRTRVEKILLYIEDRWKAQTFISDTDRERISQFYKEKKTEFRHIHITENQEIIKL